MKNLISNLLQFIKGLPVTIFWTAKFFALLFVILFAKLFKLFSEIKFLPSSVGNFSQAIGSKIYAFGIRFFDQIAPDTISRSNLIEMSLKNMKSRKTRTMITIGGMTIGISAIVFLVSIGYGLQELVTSRVARLDELRQTDLAPQPGSKVKINDKTISQVKQLKNVDKVLPIISVVGQVNYKNSVSDMAVYGVTADYLNSSAIQPSRGKIFSSNQIVISMSGNSSGEVAGEKAVNQEFGKDSLERDVEFDVEPEEFVRVRKEPTTASEVIGYSRRVAGKMNGKEIFGGTYQSEDGSGSFIIDKRTGKKLGKWIRANVPLWEEKTCEISSPNCVDGKHEVIIDESGKQKFAEGYIAEINLQITSAFSDDPAVLSLTSDIEAVVNTTTTGIEVSLEDLAKTLTASDSQDLGIASESATGRVQTRKVSLGQGAQRFAIMNRAALKVLNIPETKAVGEKFEAKFIVVGGLVDNPDEKIESEPAEYTIVAVVPDDRSPLFYIPFIDLRSLGVVNYSQLKVLGSSKEDLALIRKQAEAMGLSSRSVADTVNQINSLFGTVRTLMAVLGMVALAVASLGMFNTLTVSLLERTREVGLMKAMGMRSSEVKQLFLTESMVMSLMGGILGLFVGFLAGNLLGAILSIFTVTRGLGVIDISYIPFSLVVSIVVLSFVVGLFTGYYPSRRATKISALNALRYE